jgi:hypothetical protein
MRLGRLFKRGDRVYILKTPEENAEQGVDIPRIEAFDSGHLGPWQTVLLMQDIMEAGALHVLPHKFLVLCAYYAEVGLLTTPLRRKH